MAELAGVVWLRRSCGWSADGWIACWTVSCGKL